MSCASCDGDPYAQAVGGCHDCSSSPDSSPDSSPHPSPRSSPGTTPPADPALRPGSGRARSTGRFTDPRSLATSAQILLALLTVAPLVTAAAGGTATPLGRTAFILGPPTFLGAAVVFVCWFDLCRANAELLAPGGHRHAPGWAVGAWFVPVVMWWFPHRIARDIWRANGSTRGEWLVHAWWAAWLAKTAGVVLALLIDAETTAFRACALTVNTVAGVLAVLLVRLLTAPQSRLASGRTPAAAAAA
ncbi:DUF4328 domain-containing protein [Kitasatospora sp. NPDC056446]|uniref:DUF4328 domain-containing protein n=1 Tax=Kitasatospora sp. NPDC056446 TaxID=3345819 RepID=UPI0036AEFC0A